MSGEMLKPIDESWMVRALVFVIRYRKKHGEGPHWRDLYEHMHWHRRRFAPYHRMNKLVRRGLIFTDEPCSLDVSEQGKAQLSAYQRSSRR